MAKSDPRWITAKWAGKDREGTAFKAGQRVFYYPVGKVILAGKAAEFAAAEFQASMADEQFETAGCVEHWQDKY